MHTSAAFGRPCRIRDEDCDIEALSEDDFNFDNGYDKSILPSQESFHISYGIEMSKLAVICELPRTCFLHRWLTPWRPSGKHPRWGVQSPSCCTRKLWHGRIGTQTRTMGTWIARRTTKNATWWNPGCAVLGQHAAFLLPVRAPVGFGHCKFTNGLDIVKYFYFGPRLSKIYHPQRLKGIPGHVWLQIPLPVLQKTF